VCIPTSAQRYATAMLFGIVLAISGEPLRALESEYLGQRRLMVRHVWMRPGGT
jgi:hypothetical protein